MMLPDANSSVTSLCLLSKVVIGVFIDIMPVCAVIDQRGQMFLGPWNLFSSWCHIVSIAILNKGHSLMI